jgi:hypothetical protein
MNKRNKNVNWVYRIGVTFYDPTRGNSTLFGSNGKSWENIIKDQVVDFSSEGIILSCNSTVQELEKNKIEIVSKTNFDIQTRLVESFGNRKYIYWEFLAGEFIKIENTESIPFKFHLNYSKSFSCWLEKRIETTRFTDTHHGLLIDRGNPYKVNVIGYEPYETESVSKFNSALVA